MRYRPIRSSTTYKRPTRNPPTSKPSIEGAGGVLTMKISIDAPQQTDRLSTPAIGCQPQHDRMCSGRSTSSRDPPASSESVSRAADPNPASVPTESIQTVSVDINLRNVRAGRANSNQTEPIVLPRRRLHASIVLPPGFNAAKCELEIRGVNGQRHARTSGLARLMEGVTTLQATLDLANLSSGAYQLAVRQEGSDWHSIPVHVK
jgi:hypothetical protein